MLHWWPQELESVRVPESAQVLGSARGSMLHSWPQEPESVQEPGSDRVLGSARGSMLHSWPQEPESVQAPGSDRALESARVQWLPVQAMHSGRRALWSLRALRQGSAQGWQQG